MKKSSIFCLFFILQAVLFSFSAQIPGLINYTEEDGLNCSYLYHLRQDKNGFIWIGSDNGLYRFDGKEFKQYGKKEGLKNIDIISCEPLPNGEVFILPFLNDFAYLKNGRVINLNINEYVKNQFSGSIPKVTRDGNKLYLYGTTSPQNIFTYENGKVKKLPVPIDYGNKKLGIIKFDSRTQNLFLYNDLNDLNAEILIYNFPGKREKRIKIDKGSFICEKDQFLVFEDKGKINVYELTDHLTLKKVFSYATNELIYYGYIDKNNRLWLNLRKGGVLYFNQPLSENSSNPTRPVKILSSHVINNILVDQDDNVWFNSRNNGVFFITKALFANHINLSVKNNSEYIKAIAKDDHSIILGYNSASGAIIDKNGKMRDIILDKDYKDENKSVYINNNTAIFGLSNRAIIHHLSKNTHKQVSASVKNIVPYTPDSVFICTAEDLLVYGLKNEKLTSLLKERIYTVLPYDEENLLVGNFIDLYKFNIRTKKKTLFLKGYYFTDIKKLRENTYLGATNLHGIIMFSDKGIIRRIEKNNGLINDQVKKIEIENGNTFWASTNSGISRVELAGNNLRINNFTQTDGLPSDAVTGSVIKNDTIFIGTTRGLGIFSIKKLLAQEKSIRKKVIINSVTIEDQEHFNLKKDLTASTHNTVIFNLSFLDYASQGKISYKYKIEGLNDSWEVSSSSRLIFSSIPPGDYILRVYGLGYNGKQSYASTDLAFKIEPKFWQTWWFKLLLAAVGIAILSVLLTSYLQKKRNKRLERFYHEKKMAELELQAIKAQINPHFIYNCLNSIKYLLFKEDYEETENYLDIFSQLIRKTLYYSEKTFMPVREEIEYLSLYLDMEKLRQNELFDYEIHTSGRVNKNWVVPSLLVQPFVENAIKHGVSGLKSGKGFIRISFDHSDSVLCITVEDNGRGIQAKNGSFAGENSFGLKLSKKRIRTFQQLFETNITLEVINLSEKYGKQGTQIKLYITPYEDPNTNLHH